MFIQTVAVAKDFVSASWLGRLRSDLEGGLRRDDLWCGFACNLFDAVLRCTFCFSHARGSTFPSVADIGSKGIVKELTLLGVCCEHVPCTFAVSIAQVNTSFVADFEWIFAENNPAPSVGGAALSDPKVFVLGSVGDDGVDRAGEGVARARLRAVAGTIGTDA